MALGIFVILSVLTVIMGGGAHAAAAPGAPSVSKLYQFLEADSPLNLFDLFADVYKFEQDNGIIGVAVELNPRAVVVKEMQGASPHFYPADLNTILDRTWRMMSLRGFVMRPLDDTDRQKRYKDRVGSRIRDWIKTYRVLSHHPRAKKELREVITIYILGSDVFAWPAWLGIAAPVYDHNSSHKALLEQARAQIDKLEHEVAHWKGQAKNLHVNVDRLTHIIEEEREAFASTRHAWGQVNITMVETLVQSQQDRAKAENLAEAWRKKCKECEAKIETLLSDIEDLKVQLVQAKELGKRWFQQYIDLRSDYEDQQSNNSSMAAAAAELETQLAAMASVEGELAARVGMLERENTVFRNAHAAHAELATLSYEAAHAKLLPADKQARESSDVYAEAKKAFALVKDKYHISDLAYHEIYMLGQKYGYVSINAC